MKRGNDGNPRGASAGTIRILVEKEVVAKIIGRSGVTVNLIEKSSGSKVRMGQEDMLIMGKRMRSCDISGPSFQANSKAQRAVSELLLEYHSSLGPQSAPAGQAKLQLLVVDQMVALLIGKRGAHVNQLVTDSGARFDFAKPEEMPRGFPDRVLSITGGLEEVCKAQELTTMAMTKFAESRGMTLPTSGTSAMGQGQGAPNGRPPPGWGMPAPGMQPPPGFGGMPGMGGAGMPTTAGFGAPMPMPLHAPPGGMHPPFPGRPGAAPGAGPPAAPPGMAPAFAAPPNAHPHAHAQAAAQALALAQMGLRMLVPRALLPVLTQGPEGNALKNIATQCHNAVTITINAHQDGSPDPPAAIDLVGLSEAVLQAQMLITMHLHSVQPSMRWVTRAQ